MADGQITSFILMATGARHMKYGMSTHYKHDESGELWAVPDKC